MNLASKIWPFASLSGAVEPLPTMLPVAKVRSCLLTIDDTPLVATKAGAEGERLNDKEEKTNVVDGHERSYKGVVVMAFPVTPKAGFGEVG